ncbi:hypothetical protein ACLOJK_015568 [Asimina triloba]
MHPSVRLRRKQLEVSREQRLRRTSSVRDESSQVLGRADEAEQMITSLFFDDYGKRNFCKTTLAQAVYNDNRAIEHFGIRAWVCVAEHFDVRRLDKEIIESASKSPRDLSDIDSLQCCLRDKLNRKRFLLVLDDGWSENDRDSEQFQAPFTFGAKGSRTVVTTRSRAVSNAQTGGDRERRIAELKEVTDICVKLVIKRLENVAEAEDVQQANLKNKPFIDSLWLMWGRNHNGSSQSEQLEEDIANGLQLHCSLKRLEFNGYMGTCYLSWMMKMDMLMLLSNLKVLEDAASYQLWAAYLLFLLSKFTTWRK